jgi:hypothetical protein
MDNVKNIIDDLITDATDYIGNDPDRFDADHHTLATIRNDKKFLAYVKDEVESCVEEYEGLSQKEAAEAVWQIYLSWLYHRP